MHTGLGIQRDRRKISGGLVGRGVDCWPAGTGTFLEMVRGDKNVLRPDCGDAGITL